VNPGVLDLDAARGLHEVPNGFRTGARGTGFAGDTMFAIRDIRD
jgi:hypothetical protein